MKRVTLLTVLVLAFCQVDAKVIFVMQGKHGNGTSWETAMSSLKKATLQAKAGDQIWVAAGIYTPTTDNDRNVAFVIPNGVALYGGFNGTEATLEERNIQQNTTILSGEIGNPNDKNDNSYTVIYTKEASAATIIDGFVIESGSAMGSADKGMPQRSGAGWYNDGGQTASNPTIANCIFRGHVAFEGGAIYNYANNGTCSPSITNCKFINNKSYLNGGAIFNDGTTGTCAPKITGCTFEGNTASYGAGILNKAESGKATPLIRNCHFVNNTASSRGSVVYNDRTTTSEGICEAIMSGCRMEANNSRIGNEISNRVSSFDLSAYESSTSNSSGY
ncbi:MAG: hypothetical protein KDD02_10670 [Phaeodactylibacter sp.]|nr:hypothetical protein [Phaeodactylibacter sp.]MCB9302277.1 hypothetical protein [Lewinellaceae bacterium]